MSSVHQGAGTFTYNVERCFDGALEDPVYGAGCHVALNDSDPWISVEWQCPGTSVFSSLSRVEWYNQFQVIAHRITAFHMQFSNGAGAVQRTYSFDAADSIFNISERMLC